MENKRLLGISLYISFLPIITLLLIKAMLLSNFSFVHSPTHPFRFLYDYTVFGGSWQNDWIQVSLYILTGMGVSYLNKTARLVAITLSGVTAIYGVIELILVIFSVNPLIYTYVKETYGLDDALMPAAVHIIFILANAFVVFYLARPKVREQFK